jgi:phosphoserine phosphatase RsbU/P
MLLGRRRVHAILGFCVCIAGASSPAQQTAPVPVVRYHFGDNARWADPAFDDTAWPVAKDGEVPAPPLTSDGFVWVRVRVPVPVGSGEPLALRQVKPGSSLHAEELYLNGQLTGQNGRVPPHPLVLAALIQSVFPLPNTALAPGSTAVVAMRAWILPVGRVYGTGFDTEFQIDNESLLRTAAHERVASLLLAQLPINALFATLIVVGIGLLFLWRLTRAPELAFFGLMLISGPCFIIFSSLSDIGLLPLPIRLWSLLGAVPYCAGPILQVVFLWNALALPGRWGKYMIAGAAILSACGAFLSTWFTTGTHLLMVLMASGVGAAILRDVAMCAFTAWAVVRRPTTRLLAVLMLLPPLFSLLSILGEFAGISSIHIGSIEIESLLLFRIAFLISLYAVAILLTQRAWKSWRANQQLRVEMESARDVQQQLVPAVLPVIAGFNADAAYLPAAEVGGDFYQVLTGCANATLIVVGDVSGKGLKAAMKGALAIGAMRAIAAENLCPGELLKRLNRELHHAQDGGFVTCLCALVAENGAVILANAGHLAPYRNGNEVEISNGLPLGLVPEVEYEETKLQLNQGERFTLLSDGVLEARDAAGELFGFERTRAISTQPARSIAEAAQQFGQEDDITVLTLTFAPPALLQS